MIPPRNIAQLKDDHKQLTFQLCVLHSSYTAGELKQPAYNLRLDSLHALISKVENFIHDISPREYWRMQS